MEMATTISTCTAQMVRGRHSFQIAEYSLNKGMGVGNFIRSNTFNIGGYDWSIRYYPDGANRKSQKFISVFVELMSQNAEARALFAFRLATLQSQTSAWRATGLQKVSKSEGTRRTIWGCEKFIERTELEGSEFVQYDRLLIECFISIVQDPLVLENEVPAVIKLPPSELSNDFGKLLESKEGADVTFFVKGEAFPAHGSVLAARSTVFKAQLFGPMKEKDASRITVEDMEPDVFKFLLHFIYTDTLPPLNGFDNNDGKEVIRHLLGAADRYAIQRLKLLCESILCKSIDVDTVATTLALADQHQCNSLKDACLKFIVSPDRMEKVMASQEYDRLKRKCPNLLVEVFGECLQVPQDIVCSS